LDALERFLTGAGAQGELAGVLDRRAALAADPAEARALAFRAAELRTAELQDRGAAIEAWRGYVTAHGASREALGRLTPLLEHERRWEELAAALADDAALAPPAERSQILSRLGQIRLGRLGDARGALDAHRQALAIDPSDRVS